MNSSTERLQKLKAYYDSFSAKQQMLASSDLIVLHPAEFAVIDNEVQRANGDYPEFVPGYPKDSFGYTSNYPFFRLIAVKMYLAGVVARFKAALTDTKNTPITEHVDFSFLTDAGLRDIIERDYEEIQRAYIGLCWKSVIILSGGSVEAILLDRLMKEEVRAREAKGAPNSKPDLSRWDLSELIRVAVELKIVAPNAEILTDAVRQYRNLVHPGNELRNKLEVGKLDADTALNALKIVHRDLTTKV